MKKEKFAQRISTIIRNEDSQNPSTDVDISRTLGINRSEVTLIRSKMNIPDSRKRRKKLLLEEIRGILKVEQSASIRNVTLILNQKGFVVSRNVISNLLKEINECSDFVIADKGDSNDDVATLNKLEENAFSNLIGSNGSLKPQVELAKAAILYPPNGLHTLIFGETGVGKSELAECMYNFFDESRANMANTPFIAFNCADYAENPQLLLSHLFGYKKGAFTGADEDKIGLVEKANGGILFLDEIHRLPPEGQEIFFFLMDKGKFRRLGETEVERKINILLIAATTESLESNLLGTFRRRIPIIIELPALDKKPFMERFEIIERFFKKESIRMKANITISENVLKALILYEPSGNIGQVKSDIQVICARSFLKVMGKSEKIIKIDIIELPNTVVKGLLKLNAYRDEVDKIVKGDLKIVELNQEGISDTGDTSDVIPREIYGVIEKKYKAMKYQGIDDEIINRIIENELEIRIYKSINQLRNNEKKVSKSHIVKIVGSKIVSVVDKMMFIAKEHQDDVDESLFYCLATHLATTYDRLLNNKQLSNSKLYKIRTQYPVEFEVAKEMIAVAIYELKIDFPEDEIAVVAMYLRSYKRKESGVPKHIGVIVLSHGKVASGMASVANRLLGVNHAKFVEMPFDQSPNVALNTTMRTAKEIYNSKGILFLADMGSLTGFGKLIGEELSIKTRTVCRVDTLMVVEAVRKSIIPDADLDEIADALESVDKKNLSINIIDDAVKVIVCVCLTGDGSAKMLKSMITSEIELADKVEVLTMGALENSNFSLTIRNMLQEKKVIAVVGTINPQMPLIPFINSSEVIEGNGLNKLRVILSDQNFNIPKQVDSGVNNKSINKLFDEKTTIIDSDIRSRNEAIEKMSNLLFELGYVKESFKESVYERERLNPTTFSGGVALPHGNPEFVNKPIIGILTLKNPIKWDEENYVDFIFVMAINDYYKDEFRKLYKIINNSYFREKIKACTSYRELLEVVGNV